MSKKGSISAVVLVKNEGKNIEACLKSLQFYDEIVVIDDFSTDNTVNIAKKYTAHVFQHHLNDDFATQRNFGLQKVKGEWALFVDADERVSPELAEEVKSVTSNKLQATRENGFYIKRQDIFLGKSLRFGEAGTIKLLRLAKKNAGKWQRPVHEIWQVQGEVGELQNFLRHTPHPSIREFLTEINHYTTIEANYRMKNGYSKLKTVFEVITYPIAKFVYNYFLKLGILDGIPGLIMSVMMSYHSFLVRLKILRSKLE